MNEMKTLPLAFTYVGVFLGAGFVSGPELWQFFGAFGNWGYVGFLLAAVLFTLFGILLVRLTQVAHTDEMDRLLVPWNIPWLRAASGIVAAAFLFGVVVIMAAGSGALLEQMTGLPTWIGNALFMLAVALVALLGVTGMVSAFSALIPVLVLATLAFAAAACIKFGTGNIFRLENVNTNPLMPTWLVASLTFVAYNLLGGIGIMAPIGKLVKKRSVIYWGITLAGVMLTVVAASILFSMAVYPAAIEAELPMVAVATAISPIAGDGLRHRAAAEYVLQRTGIAGGHADLHGAEAGGVPQAQKADAGSGGGAVVDRQSGGLRGSDQRYFPGVRLSQRGIFGVHDGTLHSVQAAGKAVRLKKVTEDIPRRYCLRGISSVMGNYLIDLK